MLIHYRFLSPFSMQSPGNINHPDQGYPILSPSVTGSGASGCNCDYKTGSDLTCNFTSQKTVLNLIFFTFDHAYGNTVD